MERRTFLKVIPMTALMAETSSVFASEEIGGETRGSEEVRVRIESKNDPSTRRTFAILKDRIEQRCQAKVVEVDSDPQILFAIGSDLPGEAFSIDQVGDVLRIRGGSAQGLRHGVGKFLRTSRYDRGFVASTWRGTSIPEGTLRGMYLASHFHNWYHVAPEAEIVRYLEDLSLWGVNAIMVCFPFINLENWDDPKAAEAVTMVRGYGRIAKDLGLQFGIGAGNTVFKGAPDSIRATRLPDPTGRRGNHGHPICPSNPEGHEYILTETGRMFERLRDIGLDFLVYWPYDEGGCACEKCSPWGSRGFLKLSRDLTQLARESFPNIQTILSTWMFDTPPEGEWQGLTEALEDGEEDWVHFILADAHEDFPRYPLDVGVPGDLPLINFPEISMWGNSPWGGVGANPLPSRFQRLWDSVKHKVRGGFPYSEGIYEDLNKAVVLQFYWNRDQSAQETLSEYISYEYTPEVVPEVLALIDLLESVAGCSYQKKPVDVSEVRRAYELAEAVHSRLPGWARKNWRWEILYLRAILDQERFAGGGLETPTAEAALLRLMEIYHSELETDDPYHHRVRPPLKRAVDRQGRK